MLLLLAACGGTAATPTAVPTIESTIPAADALSANLTDGCVESYDPAIDYFPAKASLTHADGLTIDYFNNYKVVTVLNPWRDADVTFQYVLVQCGTPAPDGYPDAQVIDVPARSIITMSTTFLPHLQELGVLDRLVGVDSFAYINTPAVRSLVDAGTLTEIGNGMQVNVESIIDLDPGVIMADGIGDPQSDVHPVLLEAGLPVALSGEYMETSPLGRAEWVKFMAALFNQEATAETSFANKVTQYNDLVAQVATVTERPTVFTNSPFQGTWYISGGNSYIAQILEDAGAAYLWADDDSTGNLLLSFETVLDRAADADFWVTTSTWNSIDEALAEDERFAEFAAVQNGRLYNNNARVNEQGGNDYWESGVTNPHIILADIIKIFHPELLPEHELYYYQQLK